MKYRFCATEHNPPCSYGDCVRACLATLTDDDDVPHYFHGAETENDAEQAWKNVRNYLKSKSRNFVVFPLDDLDLMKEINPDIPYMLLCSKAFGGEHAVVGMNGKVLHDPSYNKQPIVKHRPKNCWIVFFII